MISIIGAVIDIGALVAIAGVVAWLSGKMRRSAIKNPPYVRLSLVIIIYGLALWFVASWFLPSTGLAVYVPVFLLTVAPLIMLAVAILTFRERKESFFHNMA